MSTVATWLHIDGDCVLPAIREATEKLDENVSEIILDFSSVRRLDSSTLRAIEQLASFAENRSAKVVISGVNVEVYKVLKLVKLASRFSFVS